MNERSQQEYYDLEKRTDRIDIGRTPIADRHFSQVVSACGGFEDKRVLEVGSGLGRFTEMLADSRAADVKALEISPVLCAQLRDRLGRRVDVMEGSALEIAPQLHGQFDRVVGFFFLHHIVDFRQFFEQMHKVLVPGGRLVFLEPNAFNPGVYAQVLLAPDLSFRGEPSISKMRPGFLKPHLSRAGFDRFQSHTYGFLPPAIANRNDDLKVEKAVERLWPISLMHAYRLISAEKEVLADGATTR